MSTIPSLWPNDIRVEVRTPEAILRRQVSALAQQTSGLLTGELDSSHGEGRVEHQFEVVASTLYYRARIMTITHEVDLPYPATVTAAVFPQQKPNLLDGPGSPGSRVAQSEDEFIELVREVLTSPKVRSLVSSLLARINSDNEAAGTTPAA